MKGIQFTAFMAIAQFVLRCTSIVSTLAMSGTLFKTIVVLTAIFVAHSEGAGQVHDRWPTITNTGGRPIFPSLADQNTEVVNVPHFVAEAVLWNSFAPRFALIPMSLEQALEIDRHVNRRIAVVNEAIERYERSLQLGDETAIHQARAHRDMILEINRETHHSSFKGMVNQVLDEDQLLMLKSLCVDAAIQHWGMEPLVRETVQNSEHKMTREEYQKLEETLRQIEFELRLEVIQLRMKAWNDMMAALPPELRSELEVRLNIDGIGKTNAAK